MMKYSIGKQFYVVKTKPNSFHRKKICKVFEGEEWFKYDAPLFEYEVEEITVVAYIEKTIHGDVKKIIEAEGEWATENEYCLHTDNNQLFMLDADRLEERVYPAKEGWNNTDIWYESKRQVETLIKSLKKKDRKLDRT